MNDHEQFEKKKKRVLSCGCSKTKLSQDCKLIYFKYFKSFSNGQIMLSMWD